MERKAGNLCVEQYSRVPIAVHFELESVGQGILRTIDYATHRAVQTSRLETINSAGTRFIAVSKLA